MNVTALLGLLLVLVVAPTMGARAWVAAPEKAAMFGFLAAGSFVFGVALLWLVLWQRGYRWTASR